MKREVMFVFVFAFLLMSISLIHATEEQQVEKAYACLDNRLNQTNGCSTLTSEERAFMVLATGKCINETVKTVINVTPQYQCWAASGATCNIKSTAQAVLALNRNDKVNTTKAENWLLSQTASPSDITWFLEIESASPTSCMITYLNNPEYTIKIGADKKISGPAGAYLTLYSPNNYWLRVAPQLYNQDIQITCDQDFITTFLFMKTGLSTVHVSNEVTSAKRGSIITQQISSLCFTQGGACNYEGSLWASLVLKSLGYDVTNFLPYLITGMDDTANKKYLSESFLYLITGKFRDELLLRQNGLPYWEISGNRYYDTALALLAFPSDGGDSPTEKANSISWLLTTQQKTGTYAGCWNSNYRDTAFLLFSIWPKDTSPIIPAGVCYTDSDCPASTSGSCEQAFCDYDGFCSSSPVGCVNNDGCCGSGCDSTNDNDCTQVGSVCTDDTECASAATNPDPVLYCGTDGNSYLDVYTYRCANNGTCLTTLTPTIDDRCTGSQTCDASTGACGDNTGTTCGLFTPCPDGQTCNNGVCEDNTVCTPDCSGKSCGDDKCGGSCGDCSSTGICTSDGQCVEDNSCGGLFGGTQCPDGYTCTSGICQPNGCGIDGCTESDSCKQDICEASGSCNALFLPCTNDDGCCNPGCNFLSDNDCVTGCTDSQCSADNYISDPFCGDDGNVHETRYTYTCDSSAGTCINNTEDTITDKCGSQEECSAGECVPIIGKSCSDGFLGIGAVTCPDNQTCTDGVCVPNGCEQNGCAEISCKDSYCEAGSCSYTFSACANNDGCCNPGCDYTNDNDCGLPPECTNNSQCAVNNYSLDPFCGDDGNVYETDYSYTCDSTQSCAENIKDNLVKTCASTEECYGGECIPRTDNTCGLFNPCPDGQVCTDGFCAVTGCEQDGCAEQTCKESSCEAGSCSYTFLACANDDGCCNPGCNSTNDNDCIAGPECTSDSQCSTDNYESEHYCSDDGNVYRTLYNYTCENHVCVENVDERLFKTCAATEGCYAGECSGNNPTTTCSSNYDCNYEECVNGTCVPFECSVDSDCTNGNCTDGHCTVPASLDCLNDGGGFCMSSAQCDINGGVLLEGYSCASELSSCCDTPTPLTTCADNAGDICSSDKECTGTVAEVSDNLTPGETCCVGGTCEVKSTPTDCASEGGTCKSSCDSNTENDASYVCAEGETCCVAKSTPEPSKSHLWVWIVILLLLIGLSVVGIVFRDKLRVQWIKLKDKLGGKKEKKKFEMPLTAHPNPSMQGRILPRRILPPGQGQQGQPVRRPVYPPQPPQQNRPANVQPSNSTTQPAKKAEDKKTEDKPKGELDDVLKKLREMGK